MRCTELEMRPTQKLPFRAQLPSVVHRILPGDEKSVHRNPGRQRRSRTAPSGDSEGTPPATVSFGPSALPGLEQVFAIAF